MDLWTSGSNFGTDDYSWAAGKKPFKQSDLNWKSGQPKKTDGDCVMLQFSNKSANASTFSLGNCAEEKFFTCEVNKKMIICNFKYFFDTCRSRKEQQNLPQSKKNACPSTT